MKILYVPIVVLILALGCGEEETCGSLNCDSLPCENFTSRVKAQKLSCGCAPKYCCDTCCDTCGGEQICLDRCVDRDDP